MSNRLFSKAKILIVEEQALTQTFIKQSLETLGCEHLRFAENAKFAKELCTNNKFDVVICAFNLSKQQDGYQLYEELRAKALIKLSTGFIFTSAEASPALVHSVLELQPDDFLVKPFSVKALRVRIERILNRKHDLNILYSLIDDKNHSKALKYIDSHLSKNNKYSPILLKLKGNSLLALEKNQDAKDFFQSVLNIQKFAWAQVGLVEALIANNEYILAQRMLKTMLERNETRLIALDLLGRLEIKLNQFDQAQAFLSQAAAIAPHNITRQKSLSTISLINRDYEKSYQTQKDIVTYAKYSMHDNQDIYLNAARAGIDFALTTDQSDQVNRIARQTHQYINELQRHFPNNTAQTQIDVLNARLYYLKDEHTKAKQLIAQLNDENTPITSLDGALDKAKALHELGFHQKAQQLFTQILSHCKSRPNTRDTAFLHYIQQQQSEKLDIKMGPKELNNHAVNEFNKGHLNVAVEAFSQAFRVMPHNISIALNLLQCLIDATKKQKIPFNNVLAKKCCVLLNNTSLPAEHLQRFEKLLKVTKEMGIDTDLN